MYRIIKFMESWTYEKSMYLFSLRNICPAFRRVRGCLKRCAGSRGQGANPRGALI